MNNRQRIFVDEYLKCFNATKAAVIAGYSEKTAYSIGNENLSKPEIKEEIEMRLRESHMSADEALSILAEQARGNITDFMDTSSAGLDFDLMTTDEDTGERKIKPGARIIKKIKQKVTTISDKNGNDREMIETEIELYDAQDAIDKILRVAGRYVNRTELTGKDGKELPPAIISVYLPDNDRNKRD